jgi:hypothetical protein
MCFNSDGNLFGRFNYSMFFSKLKDVACDVGLHLVH